MSTDPEDNNTYVVIKRDENFQLQSCVIYPNVDDAVNNTGANDTIIKIPNDTITIIGDTTDNGVTSN